MMAAPIRLLPRHCSRRLDGSRFPLRALSAIALLVAALGLAACGKKGPPQPPPGVPNVYPRSYPRE